MEGHNERAEFPEEAGMNSRRKLLLIICAALTMTVAVAEAAQYPTRPIRLIVASAPGGNPDINSRNLANELSKQIGQQVVVENRPGASGIIGYEALARATPDGYTLGYLSNLIATNPSLYEKLPYDFARDFQPLLLYLTGLNVLTVAMTIGAEPLFELTSRGAQQLLQREEYVRAVLGGTP